MPSVMITGANRGIGLELLKQYADAGETDQWSDETKKRYAAGGASIASNARIAEGDRLSE